MALQSRISKSCTTSIIRDLHLDRSVSTSVSKLRWQAMVWVSVARQSEWDGGGKVSSLKQTCLVFVCDVCSHLHPTALLVGPHKMSPKLSFTFVGFFCLNQPTEYAWIKSDIYFCDTNWLDVLWALFAIPRCCFPALNVFLPCISAQPRNYTALYRTRNAEFCVSVLT